MKKLTNLNELFIYQLRDLWSAQTQFVEVLGNVRGNVTSDKLGAEIDQLRQRLEKHANEIERLGRSLDFDHRGNKCEAAEGLVNETREFLDVNADSEVRDAGLIANLQRMLHYEIAGYGTAAAYARQLDLDDVFITMNDMLETVRAYDSHLTQVAKETINRKAVA